MLKRKNEENEASGVKRVALDSEAVEQHDIDDDKQNTAPVVATADESEVGQQDGDQKPAAGPISSHKVQDDDPTYVHFRMLCNVKEAAVVVGKGGETINRIKEMSNCRINVSENVKGVPERVISVRGGSENVAKAFGIIVRVILNEPLEQASSLDSNQFFLRLLFPHTIMGYIIGKKGARFREIEENSAALLKADDRTLPNSTDRILHINGVADAIHIAAYYVAQTVIEHKGFVTKMVFYNPANYGIDTQQMYPMMGSPPSSAHHQMMNMGMGMMVGGPIGMMGRNSHPNGAGRMGGYGYINQGMGAMMKPQPPYGAYVPHEEKVNQDLMVPQEHIGLVIGKGGKNLAEIRASSGCYVKVNEEVPGAFERKLTLMGTPSAIERATYLISNKLEYERQRKQQQQQQQYQNPPQSKGNDPEPKPDAIPAE
ncbi:unnamed protein product [Kuraishia capsulata CBS 1993]|uniref:K Homology domain-containing protein n=1 Tax=Kuraishia capsulata CBS 1993 TaxID=1382522 RepID=W6MFD3_9ASCO|nr:uncharacterized protein KUCA_T00000201001 [Kuraishia capsulata CBS 1993]CDK24241.1 unnamed protein product [Kuraishia capsulata CBS 1993]